MAALDNSARTWDWRDASQFRSATSRQISQSLSGERIELPGCNVLFELPIPSRRVVFNEPLPESRKFLLWQLANGSGDFRDGGHTRKSTPGSRSQQLVDAPCGQCSAETACLGSTRLDDSLQDPAAVLVDRTESASRRPRRGRRRHLVSSLLQRAAGPNRRTTSADKRTIECYTCSPLTLLPSCRLLTPTFLRRTQEESIVDCSKGFLQAGPKFAAVSSADH